MDGYQRISRYKSQLMGMAVMVVVYGHLLYYHSWLKNYEDLNFTIWYTLGSVEMFMFISGFGIYHSLKRTGIPTRSTSGGLRGCSRPSCR